MYQTNLTLLLILIILFPTHGQNGNYALGARSDAMAGCSVTIGDEWALFNNIGALSYVESLSAFATYQNRYGLAELSVMSAGITSPLWNGTAGIGFFRFGDDLLNEQRVNFGFGNRFGIVSLGVNLGYYQLRIEGAGTKHALLIDFGGQAKLTEQIYFGAHISNLNQAKLSEITGENIATIMKTGLSYRPTSTLMINAEVEKEVELDTQLKIGLEYDLMEEISIRTGILTEPFESTFGVGFRPKQFNIDYAFINNPEIGDIHEISLTYHIKK